MERTSQPVANGVNNKDCTHHTTEGATKKVVADGDEILPCLSEQQKIGSACDGSQTPDHEVILDLVAEHTVGFELSAFPATVKSWISRLAENPLPGSYQHLLLLMFADGLYCSRIHHAMAAEGTIPDFLSTHRDEILRVDRSRNIDRPVNWEVEPRKSARLRPHPDYTTEGCKIDEHFLELDLATLRELVGPLQDPKQRVFWITGRISLAKDMLKHWEASMERIKGFKEELARCQYSRKTNCESKLLVIDIVLVAYIDRIELAAVEPAFH